jgi:hypothetical protein
MISPLKGDHLFSIASETAKTLHNRSDMGDGSGKPALTAKIVWKNNGQNQHIFVKGLKKIVCSN